MKYPSLHYIILICTDNLTLLTKRNRRTTNRYENISRLGREEKEKEIKSFLNLIRQLYL